MSATKRPARYATTYVLTEAEEQEALAPVLSSRSLQQYQAHRRRRGGYCSCMTCVEAREAGRIPDPRDRAARADREAWKRHNGWTK